jgi:hypothetical protein
MVYGKKLRSKHFRAMTADGRYCDLITDAELYNSKAQAQAIGDLFVNKGYIVEYQVRDAPKDLYDKKRKVMETVGAIINDSQDRGDITM